MPKTQKKENIYTKAVKNRLIIMIIIIFIIAPTLFIIGLFTSTYTNNKPNPVADTDTKIHIHSSIGEISKTKFVINDFYLSAFKVEVDDEFLENGYWEITVDLGKKIDENISSTYIKFETFLCYNWINYTESIYNTSTSLNKDTTYGDIINADIIEKKPYFFVKIDLKKDARFITRMTWTENGTEVYYVVEHDYNDLYISGLTNLS